MQVSKQMVMVDAITTAKDRWRDVIAEQRRKRFQAPSRLVCEPITKPATQLPS
ncbi:hypothetical protein IU458_35350 [Nocardia nova]|nr:hypothetical protein [Nocardia nova]